ncbi:MAG: DUF192 domain-containing protein [Betaproteobacteria bacterium]
MRTAKIIASLCGLVACAVFTAATSFADPLFTFPLRIKNHEVRAEIANSEQDRLHGLMFREKLAENGGMIFLYPHPEVTAMWMKNTRVPLSVAFIGTDGRILNIADMEPYSEQAHPSAGVAAYALEMNRGWFSKLGIRPGDVVEGLKALPPAK